MWRDRSPDDEGYMNLIEFFKEHPRVAIAFSGGVDST